MALKFLGQTSMWVPQRKPGPRHRIAFDPKGEASLGLQTLLLFENCAQASGWFDYAKENQTFAFNGAVVPTIGQSPYGGLSFFNNELAGATDVTYGTPLASTATWTLSALVKFDGTKPPVSHSAGLAGDQGFTHTPGVDESTGQWFDQQNSGAGKCGTTVNTWTSWKRVHLTEDGSTFRVYINGQLDGSNAQAITFAQGIFFFNWKWPIADYFFWNRTLTADQVRAHYADPFGTTMKPRVPDVTLKGSPPVGGKHPGLLLMGVGP